MTSQSTERRQAQTRRLTDKQEEQLEQLHQHGPLFVGYNSRPIMKTFDALVSKGFARVIDTSTYGKKYAV